MGKLWKITAKMREIGRRAFAIRTVNNRTLQQINSNFKAFFQENMR